MALTRVLAEIWKFRREERSVEMRIISYHYYLPLMSMYTVDMAR